MKLKYKNRIAVWFMLATGVVIATVFVVIYTTVKTTVYANLDKDLAYEAMKHTAEIYIEGSNIRFANKKEWEEREHREVQVNPVFIQIMDKDGNLMDKSPNLKELQLYLNEDIAGELHYNSSLNARNLRQVQVELAQKGELKGHIIAAMSLDSALAVLKNLRNILLIAYPLILIGLFFLSRIFAGRSIAPIKHIISTTNNITRQNLSERVQVPAIKDELHELSFAINGLLDRIESTLERERQFTSDASHELRTPLASLKGTLEVLIRKERTHEEYTDKVKFSLSEIDHISNVLEKLLTLARFSKSPFSNSESEVSIVTIIDDIIEKHKSDIHEKGLKVSIKNPEQIEASLPEYYANLVFVNIINNSIKYSKNKGEIAISFSSTADKSVQIQISDQGIGIKPEDIDQVFTPFFRSDALNHKEVKGDGLGLSIAQKAAESLGATIDVTSSFGKGTTFTVTF